MDQRIKSVGETHLDRCERSSNQGLESKIFLFDCKKLGEVIFMDDSDGNNLCSSRICIKSSYSSLIFETVKVILDRYTHHVRVKEVCGWTPDFLEDDITSEEEGSVHVETEPSHGVQLREDDDLSKIQDTFSTKRSLI